MKVLFFMTHWRIGGIERLVVHLAEYLRTQSIEVVILTEDVPDPAEQFELPEDVRIFFRSFSPFKSANIEAMRDLIMRIAPDVVVGMGSTRALYKLPRALAGEALPIVLSEHNTDKVIVNGFHNDYRFLNAVRNVADFNHVIFDSFADEYPHKDKVRVIHNPIVPLQARADVSNKAVKKKILHLARYDLHQKQPQILVKAFGHIAKKYPSWSVELYGADWRDGKKSIEKLIKDLDLEDQVFAHNSTNQVEDVLKDATLFAFPSAYEGFGLAAGDALSVGLPIVAFADCDGVNQLVQDGYNGCLVQGAVTDSEAFAVGLEKLMKSEELRLEMSKNALESIKPYSLEAFLNGWKDLLQEAYAHNEKTTLSNLSDIEKDYLHLVVSGRLFDEMHHARAAARKIDLVKRVSHKLKLEPVMKMGLRVARRIDALRT